MCDRRAEASSAASSIYRCAPPPRASARSLSYRRVWRANHRRSCHRRSFTGVIGKGAQGGSVHPLYRRAITTYPTYRVRECTREPYIREYIHPLDPSAPFRSPGLPLANRWLNRGESGPPARHSPAASPLPHPPSYHPRHFALCGVANASAMTAVYSRND